MKREVPRYIERAMLALSDAARSEYLTEALARTMPHCTWYVSVALANAYETFKLLPAPPESENQDGR